MECQFCDNGWVDLEIGGEVVDTIACPHCPTNEAEAVAQGECIAAAQAADAALGNAEPADFGKQDDI